MDQPFHHCGGACGQVHWKRSGQFESRCDLVAVSRQLPICPTLSCCLPFGDHLCFYSLPGHSWSYLCPCSWHLLLCINPLIQNLELSNCCRERFKEEGLGNRIALVGHAVTTLLIMWLSSILWSYVPSTKYILNLPEQLLGVFYALFIIKNRTCWAQEGPACPNAPSQLKTQRQTHAQCLLRKSQASLIAMSIAGPTRLAKLGRLLTVVCCLCLFPLFYYHWSHTPAYFLSNTSS